ncbi:hypothetical protein PF008_g3545 [Phytophthora fragariae]|uniref:Uncharacterized protein n=1 Tax=Phytophthora fragariae TaxID=53985 RepID=A0A6G0SFP1_9STRA|nr:hypothetical protein PF008_g3545 [Phytophthora fragariae]
MSGSPRSERAGFVAVALGPPMASAYPVSGESLGMHSCGKWLGFAAHPTRSSGSLHSSGHLVLCCRRGSWSRQSGQSPTRITRK